MQALSVAHSPFLCKPSFLPFPFVCTAHLIQPWKALRAFRLTPTPTKPKARVRLTDSAQSTGEVTDSASDRCPFSWKFSWLSKTHHSSSLLTGRSRQSPKETSYAAAAGVAKPGGLPAKHRAPSLTARPTLGPPRICSNSWPVPTAGSSCPPLSVQGSPVSFNSCPPIPSSCATTTVLPLTSPVEFPCTGTPPVRTVGTLPCSELLIAPGRALFSPPACPQGPSPVPSPHLCTPGKCTTPLQP